MSVLKVEFDRFMELAGQLPVIDVRSPSEYLSGHIPGSFNIPLFDDRQREIVGTKYKKEGRLPAIIEGLKLTGPSMADKLKKALDISKDGKLLVHCWRGGMRSESMAWLFERVDIKCALLAGGYKSYRNFLLEKVGDIPNLIVIEGYTGSGKTEILRSLREMDEQIIDLEGLANHRGSVFGGIGQEVQPTTQQFQNHLFNEILKLDLSKRVWVEGESKTVGRVFLPDPFWEVMNITQNIEIQVPRSDRVERLVLEYGTLPNDLMQNAISHIVLRLGDLRTKEILQDYSEKNLTVVADKLLDYYDKTYQFSRDKYKKKLTEIILPSGNAFENALIILKGSCFILKAGFPINFICSDLISLSPF